MPFWGLGTSLSERGTILGHNPFPFENFLNPLQLVNGEIHICYTEIK